MSHRPTDTCGPGRLLVVGWVDAYRKPPVDWLHDEDGRVRLLPMWPAGYRGTEVNMCQCGLDFVQSHWDRTPAESRDVAERLGVPFAVTIAELLAVSRRAVMV